MLAYLQGVRVYDDAFGKGEGRDDIVRLLAEQTTVKAPAAYDRMQIGWLDPDGRLARESIHSISTSSGSKAITRARRPSTISLTPPTPSLRRTAWLLSLSASLFARTSAAAVGAYRGLAAPSFAGAAPLLACAP